MPENTTAELIKAYTKNGVVDYARLAGRMESMLEAIASSVIAAEGDNEYIAKTVRSVLAVNK